MADHVSSTSTLTLHDHQNMKMRAQYGVKCGGDLHMWESSGWISTIDPYGWFQCAYVRRSRLHSSPVVRLLK